MLRRCFRLAGLTLFVGALLTPAAHADTRFDVRIGVPGPPVVAPYAFESRGHEGFVWQPGYYVWTAYGERWVPGTWIRPSYGYRRPAWSDEHRGYDRRDRDDRWERDRDERRDRNEWRDREWRDREWRR
jgi:hypothetical protein